MDKKLKVENLHKKGILNGISFEVNSGEMLAIMGPSGSGKSTLLYHISGMEKIENGEVILDKTAISTMTEDELADFRLQKTGFVFQQMNMIADLNILDNILLPAYHVCKTKEEKQKKKKLALELMKKLQIADLADREITQVSGGQLQRACICRSMINQPQILFADEPTGALNRNTAMEIMDELQKLNHEGTTILMVTHDSRMASCCDRVLYLLDGKLQGEITFTKEDSQEIREEKIIMWLQKLGW